tara:strand:+ start:221 stop:1162 length:942 start_codon:yes stop_codon:yes gene_type:complete
MDFSQVKQIIKNDIGKLNFEDNLFLDTFVNTHQDHIKKWLGKNSNGKFLNHNIDLAAELIICFGKQINCMSNLKCRSMDEISNEICLRNQYVEKSTYDKTYDRLIWKIVKNSDINDFITKEAIVELFRIASSNGLLNNINDEIITLFVDCIINSFLKKDNNEKIKIMYELGVQKGNFNFYADIYKKITGISSSQSSSSVIVSNGTVVTGNMNVVSTGSSIISGGNGIMITGQKTTNSTISSNAKDCDIVIIGNGKLTVVNAYLSDDYITNIDVTKEIQSLVKDNNIIIKGNLKDIIDTVIGYNTILHISYIDK